MCMDAVVVRKNKNIVEKVEYYVMSFSTMYLCCCFHIRIFPIINVEYNLRVRSSQNWTHSGPAQFKL